jgi:hypothetical protein
MFSGQVTLIFLGINPERQRGVRVFTSVKLRIQRNSQAKSDCGPARFFILNLEVLTIRFI